VPETTSTRAVSAASVLTFIPSVYKVLILTLRNLTVPAPY
jgi:hypothetical protein